MKLSSRQRSRSARTGSALVAGAMLVTLIGSGGISSAMAESGTDVTGGRPASGAVALGSTVSDQLAPAASPASARAHVWSARYGYRVTVTPHRLSAPGRMTQSSITLTVTGGSNARVRADLQETLNLAVQKLEHDFGTDVWERPKADRLARQTITMSQLDSWGWIGSVTFSSQESLWGTVNRTSTIRLMKDLRTGVDINAASLFVRPSAADRAIRSALVAHGLPRGRAAEASLTPSTKTPGWLTAAATRSGLLVGRDQCSGTCPHIVVPWSHLPATKHGVLPRTR